MVITAHIPSKNSALLVIDFQNDFILKDAPLKVEAIEGRLDKISHFISTLKNKGFPVIYTKHFYTPGTNPIEAKLFPELEKHGLRPHTQGSEIHDLIRPENNLNVIEKTRYDAFFNTELDSILKKQNIQDLIIIGTMTNICCESTARTAMMHNYNVWFLSDLTFTNDTSLHDSTLKNIASHFGFVINSDELIKKLNHV